MSGSDVSEATSKLQADIDSHKTQADEFKEKLRKAGVSFMFVETF